MKRLILILLALLSAPALAQLPPPHVNAIQPELTAEGPATAGGAVELALVMHTRKGWHGYWLNPGDAGLPMQVDWHLPAGASVGALRYPVPGRLIVAELMNYVFEKDYAVLARLAVPAGASGMLPLSATMHWLACTDEVCVPEHGEVRLQLPVGTGTPDPRFGEWLRALPHPIAAASHYAIRGDRIEIEVPLPASVTLSEPYFFPADSGPIDYAAPQSFRRDGDRLVASLKQRDLPGATLAGVLALGDGRGLEISATPGPVTAGGKAIGSDSAPGAKAVLAAILGAILGGMLLNLMPCVFPILAIKALHLARSGGDERAARRDALAYAAGAIVGTGLLGALLLAIRAGGSAAGWAFQLQDPRTILILVLLATAITLNLLRVFELPVIGSEQNPTGSFSTGALAAFVATPCAGPFLGAALGTALLLPAAGSIAVFAALGLGLALPFVAIAFIPALRSKLPKPGAWMATFQRFLAIPMALTAAACLWLLWRQGGPVALGIGAAAVIGLGLMLFGLGLRQRDGQSVRWGIPAALALASVSLWSLSLQPAIARSRIAGTPWSEAAVIRAQAAGHPVFVDFTADWCLTCKVNEAGAINRDSVRTAFRKAGVVELVGDWTNGDPAITRFLDSRARAGVPLYLWYEPGQPEPEELPQVLTQSMLSDRASRPR